MEVFSGMHCGFQSVYSQLDYCKEEEKQGGAVPGLADTTVSQRLGPQRASRIQKFSNLSTEDDVCQNVVRKPLNKEDKKPRIKVPKTPCFVTPRVPTSSSEDTTH